MSLTYKEAKRLDAELHAANPSYPIGDLPIGSKCKGEADVDFKTQNAPVYIIHAHDRDMVVVTAIYPSGQMKEGYTIPKSVKVCLV
jgi:hypothetical protein